MKILIYGITYKKDVADLRESPVLILCNLLKKKKIPFTVYDPLFTEKQLKDLGLIEGKHEFVDIFVVGADHTELKKDNHFVVNENTIIIDGKNFFQNKVGKKVFGIGRSVA